MSTASYRLPTRAMASAGARLGCHRHFPVVVPFLRNSYALRPVKGLEVVRRIPAASCTLTALVSTASPDGREDLPHVA